MLGDKRILITGAASGMGREIAVEAARQGAKQIGITDRDNAGLEETQDQVNAQGGDACLLEADLRSADAIRGMVEGFVDWAGGLDSLVNCAGVLDHLFVAADQVGVDKLPEDVWDAVMDVNLKAVWLATKYASPHLLASDRGPTVINAASVSGMTGAGMTAYAVSKAAVIQLTRTTAINLAPNVRANAFSPGSIKTPMSDSHLERSADKRATARAMYGSHLIPRRGYVSEIAKVVCFLASDDSSFVNGANVPVDGGMMAWRGQREVELDEAAGRIADYQILDRLLAERRSCRGFLNTPVPREVVERLLITAQRTPSWCNTQPWRVELLSGNALEQVRSVLVSTPNGSDTDFEFPTGYTGAHQERRRESGWQLYDAVGVSRGDREASTREAMRNFEFFGAPHAAIITSPAELGVYGAVDCGLYVETFLLAAHALGLGACAQAALAARSPFLRELLDLDEDRMIVCGISFGYADPDHPSAGFRTRRVEVHEAVTFVDELGPAHSGGGN